MRFTVMNLAPSGLKSSYSYYSRRTSSYVMLCRPFRTYLLNLLRLFSFHEGFTVGSYRGIMRSLAFSSPFRAKSF